MVKELSKEMVEKFNNKLSSRGSMIRCEFCEEIIKREDIPDVSVKVYIPFDRCVDKVQFLLSEHFYDLTKAHFELGYQLSLTFDESGTRFWNGEFKIPESKPEQGVKVIDIDPSLGARASKIDKEIINFLDDISDRHQRSIKEIQVSSRMFAKLKKEGRIFQSFYIHLNSGASGNYRTYQPYIQHIPIIINRNFDETRTSQGVLHGGIVQMKW